MRCEPLRVCRKLHSLRGGSHDEEDTIDFRLRSGSVRCEWYRSTAGDHASQWAAIGSIASKIGCTGETLRKWVRQAERDRGQRPGLTSDERERMKSMEREIRELRQANEILRKASAYFARRSSTAGRSHDRVHRRSSRGLRGRADLQGSADRPVTYRDHVAQQADPGKASARARRDAVLRGRIRQVFEANFAIYGVRKVWRQLGREAALATATTTRLLKPSMACSRLS